MAWLGPLAELDDAALVPLLGQGNAKAFEVLYRRHARAAINLAVRLQGNTTDAEDIVHDAFVKARAKVGDLRQPAAFRAWLLSIVVRMVRSRLQRDRLFRALGMGTRTEPVDLDDLVVASGSADLRAQLAQVYALLQALSPVDRVAWTLRHVEHCQLEEVASLCDCSLATAMRRILRAQRFLDERFVSLESAGADTSADDGSDATEAKTTDSGAPAARVRRRASASNRDRETS